MALGKQLLVLEPFVIYLVTRNEGISPSDEQKNTLRSNSLAEPVCSVERINCMENTGRRDAGEGR